LTHLIAALDQNQDFHWSCGQEQPSHQNDSLLTKICKKLQDLSDFFTVP